MPIADSPHLDKLGNTEAGKLSDTLPAENLPVARRMVTLRCATISTKQ